MKRILLLFVLAMFVFAACEELSTTGTVKVTNGTNQSIVVDVNDGDGDWLGEKTISAGNSFTYVNVEEGAIDGAARFVGDSYWYYSETQYLTAGGTVYINWNYNKSAQIIPDNMTANGKDAVRSTEKINPKQ